MKSVLETRLKGNFDLPFAHAQQSVGELSNYDNHPADHGTELYERGKDIALNEHAEKHLEDINHALKAIEENNYGTCEVCGEPIPFERLQAIPTATRCIEHTEENKVSRQRPIEEEVLTPPFGKFDYDKGKNEETFFDAEDSWQAVSVYGSSETPSDFLETNKDYNSMFVESDEEIGFVERVEDIAMADINGDYVGFRSIKGNDDEFLADEEKESFFEKDNEDM